MNELSIIIPIHEYNETVKDYLNKAVNSVEKSSVSPNIIIIVGPEDVIKQIPNSIYDNFKLLINNTNEFDYCSQINFAVKNINTKYFSILEFDDVYNKHWFKNIEEYVKHKPDFSMFIPIVKIEDIKGKSYGSVNEISWSAGFADEQHGVLTSEMLQLYYDFLPCGAVIKTSEFIEIGGLKPSLKLFFWYEFLLRALNNNLKTFFIPKYGYTHVVGREDSVNETIISKMDEKEKRFWLKLAKKEYYFKLDRKQNSNYIPEKSIEDKL